MSEQGQERASILPPLHTELARYASVRALGTGGMAETFVARSVDPSRPTLVCLKRLRRALASDPAQRAHFADEARVLSRLCHPNVLTVLDAGTDLDGPFLVTELVDGLDLRRLLGWLAELGEPMPEPMALRIAHDVAEALAHAHAHGVVHRDVTPANVLLSRDGRVVLIDFGIARSDAQTQRTRTGLVKGKAAYMAPEQALGSALDARTDLFALGVMLFEMLAGARPHDGRSDVETVTNALRGRRRPLGRPLATPGLDALIESMLHPQASRRPADASLVVRALKSASMAHAGELGAWVRTACETAGPSAPRSEPGTRRGGKARANETATTPEHQIHTSVAPASSLEAIEASWEAPSRAGVEDLEQATTVDVPPEIDPVVVRGWRSEADPPTVVCPPQLGDATVLTPRLSPEAIDARPAQTTGPVASGGGRPRRMVMLLRTAVMLAGGILAGGVTGGAFALLLRCAM